MVAECAVFLNKFCKEVLQKDLGLSQSGFKLLIANLNLVAIQSPSVHCWQLIWKITIYEIVIVFLF
jgi:hypothetical protein